MTRLVPDGFLTIRQAAEKLAVAMYSGKTDRSIIKDFRDAGYDVADGEAIDAAISELWKAVDKGQLQPFAVGPKKGLPLKLSPEMSKGIPALRSPHGQDFALLRPRNLIHKQFAEWFGPDLSAVSIVFEALEVTRLARNLLGVRRRRERAGDKKKIGRPPRRAEIKGVIRDLIERRRWSPTQSLKELTARTNRRGKWEKPVSEDTVSRSLDELYSETGDRRFERVHRRAQTRGP